MQDGSTLAHSVYTVNSNFSVFTLALKNTGVIQSEDF